VLRRLAGHLAPGEWALTGSVAIDVWMREAGRARIRTSVTDIDLVAAELSSIRRGIASDFLVSHYHVPQPGFPKFLLQLVDQSARLRIDIFPDTAYSIASAVERTISGVRAPLLPAARILDHKLRTLAGLSAVRPVAAKHFRDASALAELCGCQAPQAAEEFLIEDVYSAEIGPPCERCGASRDPDFPLAPKEMILGLLGYV